MPSWARRTRYPAQEYDGALYLEECACDVDDLAMCVSEDVLECVPGHRVPCKSGEQSNCCTDGFRIIPAKDNV